MGLGWRVAGGVACARSRVGGRVECRREKCARSWGLGGVASVLIAGEIGDLDIFWKIVLTWFASDDRNGGSVTRLKRSRVALFLFS